MRHKRRLVALLATAVVLAPLAWFWQASLVPGTYSVMDMGRVDYGGGPAATGGHHAGHTASVADLVAGPGEPDVTVKLTARSESFDVGGDKKVRGYTLNGQSPGPAISATVGDLIEVRVHNEDVTDGISLHWHGIDVPNAEDGVAGVTQDAIGPGEDHTYRFAADKVGTYWYHSHQVSHEQVVRGLFGSIVVRPAGGIAESVDVTAVAHTYAGTRTVNGKPGNLAVEAEPGMAVRVRAINTDSGPAQVWSDTAYRVAAIDGWDLHGPTPVTDKALTLTAGGRADLVVTSPARVQIGSATAVVVGPSGTDAPAKPRQPTAKLDLLSYGTSAPTTIDVTSPDRTFEYEVGRRPGFVDGKPGFWWTINGHLFPDVPMFVVREGEVVVMRIDNHSGDVHPMHLHGHHALVLSRDGLPSTGSPWWTDSLNVEDGERFEIAFLADNPGVWMDHCHNLEHAADGLVAHLMYEGVSTPYEIGGKADNSPE